MSIRIKQGDKWVEVKVPILTDASLSMDGQAADAKEVGDRFNSTNERLNNLTESLANNDQSIEQMMNVVDNLPVKVSTDGFTDVLNTRLPIDIAVKETTGYIDGSSDVEIAMNLSGNKKVRALLSFDKNNKPTSLQASNIACPITWSNIKVPSVDVGTTEEEFSTFIIQNGAINTSDFGSYNTIKANGYESETNIRPCYVERQGTYLRLYGGSFVSSGDNAMGGVVNRIGFEYNNSFDLTNYHKLIIDVNYMNYAPVYLKLKKVGASSYSSTLIVGSAGSKSDYTVEFDLSSYSGKYYIAIEARTANTYGNDEVRITNMYMIGKITSVVPDVLYMMGPSGGDTNTFGSFSGYRVVINSNNFALQWPNGQNGDYVDDPQNPTTGGATPNLTHSKYVDFSEYKNMKIVASLGSGYVASCEVDLINSSGTVVSTKDVSMGTNNFNIQSIIQTYGPNLKIRFRADLRQMGTIIYITEVSFSK